MKDRIDFYEKNLERVNYWLQFAEAKNAAMIAFVVAMLAVIYSFFSNIIMLVILSLVYVIALIISTLSMFPKGNMNTNIRDGDYVEEKDNYLYWKDIAKYSKTDYIEKVNKQFFDNNSSETTSRQEFMLAEEIITNARIAKYKYYMFELATKVVIVGTVLIPICLICNSIIEKC